MSYSSTVFRILIASPSDVNDERDAVEQTIHVWNLQNAKKASAYLEPIRWETHATPEMGDRPQAILNKQFVRECDVLIGIFWTRIGTATGVAESGTVEEIQEFHASDKPIMLYFSSRKIDPQNLDDRQYKLLSEFRHKCEGDGIIEKFASVPELRKKLLRQLTSVVDGLIKSQPLVSSESGSRNQRKNRVHNRKRLETLVPTTEQRGQVFLGLGPSALGGELMSMDDLRDKQTSYCVESYYWNKRTFPFERGDMVKSFADGFYFARSDLNAAAIVDRFGNINYCVSLLRSQKMDFDFIADDLIAKLPKDDTGRALGIIAAEQSVGLFGALFSAVRVRLPAWLPDL